MYKQWLSKISFAFMIAVLVLAVLPIIPVGAATNTASSSGFWNDTNTWGGASVPNSGDDVIINSGITVTIPAGYLAECNTINFTTGTAGPASIVLAESTSSLTVNGAVKIQEQASAGYGNRINVGAGSFSAASIDLLATTNASRYSEILISTGTATISGNITSAGMASRIIFSNPGIINVGGTFLSGAAGTFTPSTGTVNFNAGGAQTVGAYTYYNLMLSGSGSKSLPAGSSVNGNLSIAGSAKASVAANQNISVGTLKLGGLGTDNGTWGSTSSSSTYQADNFFDPTTGYLTVTTDTRTPREKLEVTGPDGLTYGTPGMITSTGGSANEAISYSHGLSSGCTVDKSGVITVTNVSGTCTVTATRAENGNYIATESDEFGVTLNQLAVILSGSRVYDTTNQAAAKIHSITNKIGTDDVTIAAYGSATLAGANVGTQSIISTGTLVLYGASAHNYTLSGATGSVTITKADQAALTVTGPDSLTYGSQAKITYGGGSGTGAISYSHGSSSGCRVDSSGLITVTNASGTSACKVTATRAEDGNYLATKSAEYEVTLNRRVITLYGSRAYDTTNVAVASNLSITNKVGADDVKISGSATLANANVGTQFITSTVGLALTGSTAPNYTLTGASGSVKIAKINQSITFNQPASPATYNSKFTVLPIPSSGLAVTITASGACAISGSNVSMSSGTGTCTLTASQAGDANYYSAPIISRTVAAQKANQTITFIQPASPATYNSSFLIAPTSSSAQPVNVGASGGCTISGNTVSMISGTAPCTLTASQAGDANYNGTSVQQTVTAQKANQTITFAVPVSTAIYNSTFMVSPTSSSGLAVTVTASGACAISGSTVTMTSGTDTCTLTASQAGDANYNGTNVKQTVTAQKANQGITFPAPASPATYGSMFTVSPTADSGLTVTIKAEGACSNSGNTVSMTSGTGICTLTASQAGNEKYHAAFNKRWMVTAQRANQAITFPTPASPATYGSTFTVSPTADSGLTVTIKAEGACSISGSNVTMTSGTDICTLTASQAGDANYNPVTYNIKKTVTAQKANQTITFNQPASPAIYLKKFTVYPTSSSGLAVIVLTSGGCTISSGTVTMISGTDTCTLTALQAGNNNYNRATNEKKVMAQKVNQTITFNPPASPATYNSSFTVAPTSSSGLVVKVTSSGGCTISGNTVTMISGTTTCTLDASQSGDTNYSQANPVRRQVTALKVNQSITFNPPASPATYNSKFTVYPTSSSGLAVTVTPSGVCTISGNTVTMTSGEGTCKLTASRAGDANYNPATKVEWTVTAQKANQSITFTAPASPATYNTSFLIAPTSSSGQPVNVSASGGCIILDNFVTMTSGTVSCALTASQSGNTYYNPVTDVKQEVKAQKANQAPLTVTGPSSLTNRTTGTIIYSGGSGAGNVLFSVGSSTGCTVNSSGVITVTNALGSCTIWVTKESDHYFLATTSAGFEVLLK